MDKLLSIGEASKVLGIKKMGQRRKAKVSEYLLNLLDKKEKTQLQFMLECPHDTRTNTLKKALKELKNANA